jgi:hypothetical protein
VTHCELLGRAAQRVTARSRPVGHAASVNSIAKVLRIPHALAMFVVTEAQAAMLRTAYEQRGEFSAAVELRRLFPGIATNAQARLCVRTIAGWRPLPKKLRPTRLRTHKAS